MNDRELLELAAKAAVYTWVRGITDTGGWWHENPDLARPWNPLTDDGDAFRLAVKLRIVVDFYERYQKTECACAAWGTGASGGAEHEELGGDPYAATRRAIVRAAAEIGKVMP